MSTETDESEVEAEGPVIEAPEDEAQGVESEDASEGAVEADPEGGDAAEPESPQRQPWHVKRLGKVVQERDTLKAELEATRAKLAEAESNSGTSLYTEDEVRARIDQEATRRANATTLNSKLDGIFAKGVETNGKAFEDRVNGYVQAFGAETMLERQDFFEAVADLPNAAEVIFALGGDLDHMAELLEMPAHKMGRELGLLSAKLAGPKGRPLSRAPAPIKPLEVVNISELDLADPKLPMNEYVRRRQEARAERRAGGRR